jgi:hypothetical protein
LECVSASIVALQYCHPTAEVFAVAVKLSGAAGA